MLSRSTIFALVALILALFLTPQIIDEARSDGCIAAAPSDFVREKVLSYDFIHDLQDTSSSGPFDALRLKRDGHYLSAILAKPKEYVELKTPTSHKDGPRWAGVVANTEKKFEYREDFGFGQRMVHTIFFKHSGKHTILEYRKDWKGNFVMLMLRWSGISQKGVVFEEYSGGMDGVRKALNEAWENGGK